MLIEILFALVVVGLIAIWLSVDNIALPSYIPGPPSPSWVAGHAVDIWTNQEQAGDLEFSWFKKYGTTIKLKGTFGTDILMTSDPRALHYIMHTAAYTFEKAPEILILLLAMTGGRGLLGVTGKTHQRQRKVLNPAFSESQIRGFVPLFQRVGNILTKRMVAAIGESDPSKGLNMHFWFGKASLDVIGEATFAHRFNSLEDENSEMGKIMSHFMDDSSSMTKTMRVGLWMLEKFPSLKNLLSYSPSSLHRRFLQFQVISKRLAKKIVDEAKEYDENDSSSKDMLSILVRANQTQDKNKMLVEEEVLSQAPTIISAGQETSSSTLSWMFCELSKNLGVQEAIRQEIFAAREEAGSRPFTVLDYDGMKLLNAAIKETLRFHPILGTISRQVQTDDAIPLSEPLITADGRRIDCIPVKKGQLVECSAHVYNRNPAVWGPDADIWRPQRWDEEQKEQIDIGLYANLLTFSGGVRGCVGWRFALLELQAFSVEMLENFRFAPTEASQNIRRLPGILITPRVAGKYHEGLQMPLQVTPL
ncbi:cytochrome P450 [Cylindrobasidium torrendii FP15055 ss-10]|uniref:Cytochrome P450 n=1 Tax=Cylindrobasidium torrendii FP15055 ss-10 TaxID=1314674 RepID=A0A0D7BRC7_9AGAR|nr:cytochrome P450 [Cylindrobasidium torrendii FP15055 ss-10]